MESLKSCLRSVVGKRKMKSRIDLTSHSDFNPDNFRINKVESRYYDNNSNSYRTPWDKTGNVLRNHRISYWNSITNTGWNLSWTGTTSTITPISISNINNLVEWFSPSVSSYITSDHLSDLIIPYTINYYNTTPILTYKSESLNDREFKCGRVSDIRNRVRYKRPPIRSYDRHIVYSYKHSNRYLDNRIKYKYARKYEGYYGSIWECTVGEFREMNFLNRVMSGYLLSEFYRSNRKMASIISQDQDKKVVKWFDRHDDYLRIQMGLRPRNGG